MLAERSQGKDPRWYRRLTNLRLCHFNEDTSLNDVVLSNGQETIRLADVRWNGVNVTVIDWERVRLGDEILAGRYRGRPAEYEPEDGLPLDRIDAYKIAVRANRQVAAMLRTQGMNEVADHFSYRSYRCQRHLYRLRGPTSWSRYLTSWFMEVLAGYGYRPQNSLIVYVLTLSVFGALYFWFAQGGVLSLESVRESFVISLAAFHGRGFVTGSFPPNNPLAAVSVSESFVGLIIDAGFIAAFTNRFFSR